jgi:co-chaperonin GroES (HSP10)
MIKPNKELIFAQTTEVPEKVTEGGILVNTTVIKGLPKYKVVFVADNDQYKVGDIILAKPGTGWDHEDNDEKYKVLRFDDIVAIITEDSC